jgi:Pentapeptide repeats (8 copies)
LQKRKAKIPVWVGILVVVLLSVGVVSGVVWRWASIAKQRYENANKGKIAPTEQLAIEKDTLDAAIKILQTMGALGFFFTAYVSWKSLESAEDKLITERFSKAVELLSESDKLEARIGGIYLLERIAKDYPEDHSTVMEVLSAYVREKSPRRSDGAEEEGKKPAKVTADIQSALTVISRRDVANDGKEKLNLSEAELFGANLRRTNLSHANLIHANLVDADLSEANLYGANLSGAILVCANLSGAKPVCANLSHASLIHVNLSDAKLGGANLSSADLSGMTNFSPVQIQSANNWGSAIYDGKRLDDPEVSKKLELDASP